MSKANPKMNKTFRTALWMLVDALLVNLSLFFAQVVRYSAGTNINSYFRISIRVIPAMTVIFLLVFWLFGIYRTMWQYASASDVLRIALASLTATLLTYAFSLIANLFVRPLNLFRMHRMVYLLHWLITIALVGASRLLYRTLVMKERFSLLRASTDKLRRVMVVGAGWAGASLVHEMQRGRYGNCVPVIVVDDDKTRTGSSLSGVPVVRGSGNILKLASDYRVEEIIIAIATPQSDLKPLIEKCLATGCHVRRMTLLQDVNGENAQQSQVRDININDLLGRPEEHLNMTPVADFFRGKTVLITGGGGSIGSELVRQLLPAKPAQIVLFDIYENTTYELYHE
ncbi:MAG: polysaccharide biosynthesis protein, partial [Candidatus Limiplasma sp.]|nr:polysaccharide biosynthesis protein [Candidatus Limiplasma sp.]